MSVKITYFVHGTTTDNEQKISSGWFDVELSELWVKQSTELKELTKDKKFDVIFSSDLKRAVNSANLAFGWVVGIFHDKRLRECNYGDFNAKPSSKVEPLQEKNIVNKFPNGESYEDVKSRISDFLDFLRKNYDWKHIGIVAHKAPQIVLDVLIKKHSWKKAFASDWRKTKSWQPGWEYILE